MQIDWFTFTCQVINFLVLVWLLKRLLYRPVLNAVEEREKGIALRLQSAEEREAQAERARRSFEQQQSELAALKDSLLAEAAADVDLWRKEQQAQVREETAKLQQTWHEAIAREQQKFLGELRQRTAGQVQNIVRHVLRELTNHDLEQQSLQCFLSHLDQLLPIESAAKANSEGEPFVVRTAFPLRDEEQETLSAGIKSRLGDRPFRFEVDPDLICGVELVVGDRKFEWNVDQYLNSLERSIATALDQRTLMQNAN